MSDIKDSVGDGGFNNVHDVALVQAMLTVVKNPRGHAYLSSYDGKPGHHTVTAITAFQIDQGLVPKPVAAHHAAPPPAPPAAPPAVPPEKAGLVGKGSPTFTKLAGAVPAAFQTMMIIENTRTVYFPGSAADAQASSEKINKTADLEKVFRTKVALLVDTMFDKHKIVLQVTPSGGHRTFLEQFNIWKRGGGVTKAGPGESNHNFGRAVDIGFQGFQWLKSDGVTATDDFWLNVLTHDGKDSDGNKRAAELWKARDDIAVRGAPGLFNSILDGDDDHLQSFDDHLPNDKALAALMNLVGKFAWKAEHGSPRRYLTDLGFGGTFFNVGTSIEIWDLRATVTREMIAKAKTEVLVRNATPLGAAAVKAVKPVKVSDVKDDDVKNMRKALKDEFVAAEANWEKWTAVP
ncbi:MAG: hypothetical protein WA324_25360 [Bryobacteraceae bacterium]